jgi:hypothetical protein
MNDLLFAVKGPSPNGAGPSGGPGGQRPGGGPGLGYDVEAGYSAAQSERGKEMDEFFAKVEEIKGDMQEIKGRQRDIRAMHERSKTIVRQKEMQRHREEMQVRIEGRAPGRGCFSQRTKKSEGTRWDAACVCRTTRAFPRAVRTACAQLAAVWPANPCTSAPFAGRHQRGQRAGS